MASSPCAAESPTPRQLTGNSRYSRHLIVVTGIAVLIWSGMEDSDAALVTLLGAFAAAGVAAAILDSRILQARFSGAALSTRAMVFGTLVGALTGVTAPLLMLFKNVRHAHIFPDYPPEIMLATMERAAVWALAGGLAGFGIGILLKLGIAWTASRRL